MSESWKVTLQGGYRVSNLGNVTRLNIDGIEEPMPINITGKTPGNPKGYRCITVNDRIYMVSRLTAAAFIGPVPSGKPYVMRIDGNSLNDSVSNLRYASMSEITSSAFSRPGVNRGHMGIGRRKALKK